MATINKFVGKMAIDGIRGGWQEVMIMKGETLADAKADMAALITGRVAMLSNLITINYATVSDLGVKRDSYLAHDGPIDGSSTVTTAVPNRDADSFLIRQETGDGKQVERHLRGVPDDCITGSKYDDAGVGGAYETALAAYLVLLKNHTALLKKPDPTDPTTWVLVPWAFMYRRGISEHKVGRFFDTLRGRHARV